MQVKGRVPLEPRRRPAPDEYTVHYIVKTLPPLLSPEPRALPPVISACEDTTSGGMQSRTRCLSGGLHVLNEVKDTVGVAALVIVPGHQLHEVVR